MKKKIIGACVCLALAVAAVQAEDTPAEQARKVADQAMAKALAEKARNDVIVEQQRAAERAAKEKAAPKPNSKPTSSSPK